MEQNLNKIAWREAATGGLWLGLTLCAATALSYVGRQSPALTMLSSLLQFGALIGFPLYYARKMAKIHGAAGFTYMQGLGFILRMQLFTGVIAGFGQFIMQNYVDPEFYREIMEKMIFAWNLPEDQLDAMVQVMRNPVLMIFSGIFSTILYGGIVGLFIAAFTKRPADPFGGDTPEENNTDQTA